MFTVFLYIACMYNDKQSVNIQQNIATGEMSQTVTILTALINN